MIELLLVVGVVIVWRAVAAQRHAHVSGLVANAIEEHQLQRAR